MTERLHFHFSLSCIGEGNGNPLQRSCLENPRDGGAWWVAVYGVTQSRTRLKWLSSSSKTVYMPTPCWLKHLCSIRALVPMSFFLFLSLSISLPLSLSLFFRLIPWSAEAHWAHSPARASKTLSRRRSMPSLPRQGTWCLREQCKPHTRGFIGFLHKPRNISLFLSPLLSYRWLQTTRFRSIKGPQHHGL